MIGKRNFIKFNQLNNWTCLFCSLYEWQCTSQPRDYYRLDRLAGWNIGQHAFTYVSELNWLIGRIVNIGNVIIQQI